MAPNNWQDLANTYLETVERAGELLKTRGSLGHTTSEIEDWANTLDDLERELAVARLRYAAEQIDDAVRPAEESVLRILSDSIDVAAAHLRELGPDADKETLDLILRNVTHHAESFLGAGPHGPGEGPPDSESGSGSGAGGTSREIEYGVLQGFERVRS